MTRSTDIPEIARQGLILDRLFMAIPDPVWQGQDDTERLYIGTFSPQRRIRLWQFIVRRADVYALRVSYGLCYDPMAPSEGSHAADDYEQYLEAIIDDPMDWLLNTRFMQALAALLIGDGNAHVVSGGNDPRATQRLAASIEW